MIYRGPQMQDIVLNPLPTTNRVALRSSSLAHVAYDRYREILQVEFRDRTVYQYVTVPIQTYYDLLRADSQGSYFNRHIRSCYPHNALRCTALDSFPA
jgi:KTSC domain-containing protein